MEEKGKQTENLSEWFEGRKHNLDKIRIKDKKMRYLGIDDTVENRDHVRGMRCTKKTIVSRRAVRNDKQQSPEAWTCHALFDGCRRDLRSRARAAASIGVSCMKRPRVSPIGTMTPDRARKRFETRGGRSATSSSRGARVSSRAHRSGRSSDGTERWLALERIGLRKNPRVAKACPPSRRVVAA